MTTQTPEHPKTADVPSSTTPLIRLLLPMMGIIVIVGVVVWGFGESAPYGSDTTRSSTDAPAVNDTTPSGSKPESPAPEEPSVAATPVDSSADDQTSEGGPETIPPAPITVPQLSLAESDVALAEDLPTVGAGQLGQQFIAAPNALERFAAIVDNLRQGNVPYKILPIDRPQGKFLFRDDGLKVTIDPAGFSRYDALADALDGIDAEASIALYRRYQRALEEAWSMLGYTELSLDDALRKTLAEILLTPRTELNARLLRKEAVWIYEDERLENLSGLQKQLMRMGPTNADKIQNKAREIRGALLDSE